MPQKMVDYFLLPELEATTFHPASLPVFIYSFSHSSSEGRGHVVGRPPRQLVCSHVWSILVLCRHDHCPIFTLITTCFRGPIPSQLAFGVLC